MKVVVLNGKKLIKRKVATSSSTGIYVLSIVALKNAGASGLETSQSNDPTSKNNTNTSKRAVLYVTNEISKSKSMNIYFEQKGIQDKTQTSFYKTFLEENFPDLEWLLIYESNQIKKVHHRSALPVGHGPSLHSNSSKISRKILSTSSS
ncbi:uncharacterized protein OCT59_005058 [Rhizophagus irregularis]|uniref:uncharacterized protein n=1 Tax=Rhizophagus irregularis TaxID=588596 RepID=UPI0033340F08|nr:hypothetical protein OCT59_005058 [Rhizophagus irregularis]